MHATPSFIYFDLGNVLVLFDHQIACDQMAKISGLTSDQVRTIAFESDLQWQYERGDITTEQFFEQFCAETSSKPELNQLLHAASDMFWVNEGMIPVVRGLKQLGLRLGILSNTCPAHWEFINSGRFDTVDTQFFEVAALSYEMNRMKPEPEIYAQAASMAGVNPHEIFFTDDRTENVSAARDAGFDAVLFKEAGQLVSDLVSRGISLNIE